MPPSNSAAAYAPGQVLDITRVFDAPRELVFKLWSAPEHLVRWWGPEGYHLSHCELDFRIGGSWRFCMQRGADERHWIGGVYREVTPPSRLVFSYVGDTAGYDTLVEIDFIDLGERTEMRFRQAPFPDTASRDSHNWGWSSTLGLLAAYLPRARGAAGKPVGEPRGPGRV